MKQFIIAAMATVFLASTSNAAWLLIDDDGNLVHHPTPQNIQEGEPWVDSNGVFLGFWIWV